MSIFLINRQRKFPIDKKALEQFTHDALKSVHSMIESNGEPKQKEVSIVFVGDKSMRGYNRDFRGKDRPTDVLSFPTDSEEAELADYLGDIIISADTANRDANELNLTFEVELRMLIIHGLLHLMGYDHEADKGEMSRLERRLRKKLL